MRSRSTITLLAGAALLALAGCGGEDSPAAAGGTLTISGANPAANNTTLDVSKATTSGNDARAADGFSSTPYCDIYAEGVPGANGKVYAVQVYFRQSDKAALNVSLVGSATASAAPDYIVFDNNSGNPITGVTVNTTERTVTFANKALADGAGQVGTLNGTATFKANATGVAGCGV